MLLQTNYYMFEMENRLNFYTYSQSNTVNIQFSCSYKEYKVCFY